MGLALGVAALVISTIIAFVIVQTVSDVDDDIATAILGTRVVNETGFYLNGTTYTVAKALTEVGFGGFTVIEAINSSDATVIGSGNYTTTTTGTFTNVTAWGDDEVYITYDYTYKPTEGTGDRMITNFTSGVDNVASKIPTILLIAAVVLILGVLGLLWSQYRKMNIGGGSEL